MNNLKPIDETRTIVDGVSTLRVQRGYEDGMACKGIRLTVGTGRDPHGFASSIKLHLLQPDIDWLVEQLTGEEESEQLPEPVCGMPLVLRASGPPTSPDEPRCVKAVGHDGEHHFIGGNDV